MYSVDLLCLLLVDAALASVGMLKSRFIVLVGDYRVIRGSVAGGDLFERRGIVYVLDSVFAEDKSPIRLGLGRFGLDDLFVKLFCLIKFAFDAQGVSVNNRYPAY